MTVTPGVRFADGDLGDQVRVTTPAKQRRSVPTTLWWVAPLPLPMTRWLRTDAAAVNL